MNDATLRAALVSLLRGGVAHLTLDGALEGLEPTLRAKRPPGLHSVWELVEHMRIDQEDLLRYAVDPTWTPPPWPEGYWPDVSALSDLTDAVWEETVGRFKRDLAEAVALAGDTSRDLTAPLPQNEAHTPLRQLLLIVDHNAYHLGQTVCTRRALGDWAD